MRGSTEEDLMTVAALTNAPFDLEAANRRIAGAAAPDVVRWAAETFGQGLVMTSSFGAESALMLHLVTQTLPGIPVITVDTGYFFPETYVFMEELRRRFKLNLRVYQSPMSPAYMEALLGRLWEPDKDIVRYNQIRKVEPMERAIRELGVKAWLAGLRADQTDHRSTLRVVEARPDGVVKIHPILHWTAKDIHDYFKRHDMLEWAYHPLYHQGYASIGDHHSTRPITDGMNARDGRFLGLKQECGLHLPTTPQEEQSRTGSDL
jgi:phosphoadenosine phosphosulfate reductase